MAQAQMHCCPETKSKYVQKDKKEKNARVGVNGYFIALIATGSQCQHRYGLFNSRQGHNL